MPTIREPPKGPPSVFALATPQHMLTKLGWEIGSLRDALSSGRNELWGPLISAYHAYNCAVTSWHLVDWTWCSADAGLRASIGRRYRFDVPALERKGLERFADSIASDCRALHICRVIANGSKHMKVGKPDSSIEAQIQWTYEPEVLHIPCVVDGAEVGAALEIFEDAFRYWKRLLASLGFIEAEFISSDDDI
jgi:hypothetical protein